MGRILVTGSAGVVGRRVVPRLIANGHSVVASVRTLGTVAPIGDVSIVATGEIGPATDWSAALAGVDTVVHLAARTPGPGIDDAAFHRVNAQGTERLAQQAAQAGVELFILVSSVFAVTASSSPTPVDEDTLPAPTSAYGRSKLAAEAHVFAFGVDGRTAVVLRPPLVHSPEAKGNLRLLLRLAASSLPLPFAMVRNRRSLISAESLADAIAAVADSRGRAEIGGAYLLADEPPLGLRDVVHAMRRGMGMGPRMLPVPPALLALPLRLAGRTAMADSLFSDLVIRSDRFRSTFPGWTPSDSTASLEMTAAALSAGRR